MKSERINSWLSLGANVGVVVGLILVAYQINQEAELMKVQLFSDATTSMNEFNQALMGDSPLEVVAKSIENPHELTLAEMQIMDAYLISAINEIRRLELLRQSGLDVEGSMEGIHAYYFGTDYARAWFQEYGGESDHPDMNKRISETDPEWVIKVLDAVLARLDDDAGQTLSRDNPVER
jgi:hypothetical protein